MASWASVVAGGQGVGAVAGVGVDSISEEELAEAQLLVRDDHLEIDEESSVGCFSRWKFGLVGRFVSGSQPISVIKAALNYYWGRLRNFEILQAREGAWLILFDSESDLVWALSNGPWAISGHILFLERWTPCFDFSSEVKTKVPVWLMLPDLPKSLMSRSVVIALAARVGDPLHLDSASLAAGSSRSARVKVLCDLASPLLAGSRIVVNGFCFWQRFQYGGFTKPCSSCGLIGHSHLVCSKMRFDAPRGRSRSRRERRSSTKGAKSRRPSTVLPGNDAGEGGEVRRGAETEPESALKLVIELNGTEDAIAGVAGVADVSERGELLKEHSVEPFEEYSDADGEPVSEKRLDGRTVAACRTGETSKSFSVTRETRRSKNIVDNGSVADKFRGAGATEGLKVKPIKPFKATKVAFEQ